MSSEKKHRSRKQAKISPFGDEDVEANYFGKKSGHHYFDNTMYTADIDMDVEKVNNKNVNNKFRGVAEKAQNMDNAINLITNVKQAASKWRNYATSKRMRQKKEFGFGSGEKETNSELEKSETPHAKYHNTKWVRRKTLASLRESLTRGQTDGATAELSAERPKTASSGGPGGEDVVDGSGGGGMPGLDRRYTGGIGLAEIGDDFIPDSKSTSRQMIVASNRTLLQYFARLGSSDNYEECIDLDFVESLFKNGALIDCTDKYGQTVFHEVARAWHVDVAKFLLENGGDLNVADVYGRTPLHVAAAVDYADMVKFLINSGAEKESRTKGELQTPVHYAAKNDACQSLKALVKLDCQYKMVRDYKKRTPVQLAAELDRSETAALLLEIGAPVGVQDDSGQPAIVWMITKMAPVAKEGLNQFHITDRANRKQYYFLNHLEPKPPKDLDKKTCAQTALEVITAYRQFDLVTHEAVKRLIHVKWKEFGKLGAWSNLIFNLVFILLWTILGVYPDWKNRYKYEFPTDVWRVILWVAAVVLTIYQLVAEVLEYRNSRRKHLTWKNWREREIERDRHFCHPRWPEEEEFLLQEMKDLDKVAPQYFNDLWNIFDWVCYVLLLSCIITHIIDVSLPEHSITLAHAHIRIMSINIILLWLRLMKNARAFATLGPFIAMLGHILNDVFKFVFLFMEFYIPYFCAFWMTLGGSNTIEYYLHNPAPNDNTTATEIEIPGYGTPQELLFSLWRLTLVDEYPYPEMKSVDPIMTDILVGTWFALSAILCLNLFIALMSDTFQRVYDNAHANAVMQKAMTIMNIQEGLPRKRRIKFMEFIHSNCGPEIRYYDDDMASTGETDLKKVAFQVKEWSAELREGEWFKNLKNYPSLQSLPPQDELEEIREWFHAKFGPADAMSDPLGSGTKKGLNGQNLTVDILENEIDVIRGALKDMAASQEEFQDRYERDMADVKGLLEEIVLRQGGGRGGGGEGPLDVYEPAYDAPYIESRETEHRRSRKRDKRKRSKPRRSEVMGDMDDGTGLGLDVEPLIEVASLGHRAAAPPPPDMGLSTDMGPPDTTDA